MPKFFEQVVKNRTYKFNPVFYGDELVYTISFNNDGKIENFKMKRDESGMWKIQAQILPIDVHDADLALNDAIENEIKKLD